ncbi:hypothetical protein BM44_279 [Burkholderia mallei NCTC 10247]|nr:hypothetical protein BM44_279 [Burkholderia mallei NCTC 10247]AJX01762.1 hypothetical protein BM45_3009 [Burkholderia mallei]
MPSITPMMSAILPDAPSISCIVDTTSDTTVPPRDATLAAFVAMSFAWRAAPADCVTVDVISSIDAAVCCRLAAADSVRRDRS